MKICLILSALLTAVAVETDASKSKSVIVIGSGMAGVKTARDLVDNGYTVTIVEARNRIGGRTFTDHSLGYPIELGASWIHGHVGNPLTTLAEQYNISSVPTDYTSETVYNIDGSRVSTADEKKGNDQWEEIERRIATYRAKRDALGLPDQALSYAVDQAIDDMKLSADERQYQQFKTNTFLEHEYGGDVTELGLYNFDEGEEFFGSDLLITGGYDGIINGLAQGLTILLEHEVTKVDYSTSTCTVTTTKATLTADFVVVTVPLGVLKRGSIKFNPSLPATKTKAINNLQMGVLNKVYLEFPSVFWEKSPELLEYISKEKGHFEESYNMYFYEKKPILLMFNAATYGTAIEAHTDDAIVAEAVGTLRTIFGTAAVPDPVNVMITRWHSDPFSYGSYSYSGVGATPADRVSLASSVNDRLFFAGEATSRSYPATNHGAYLSGEDAAVAIMKVRSATAYA